MLGRDRRAHEDAAVVVVARCAAILHRDRVEERLGALRLLVVDQEADEVELDLLPEAFAGGAVLPGVAVFALDLRGGLVHAAVVEVDAVAGDVLDGEPVARLEMPLRGACALAKHRIVVVEALEHQARDAARLVGDRAAHLRRRAGPRSGTAGVLSSAGVADTGTTGSWTHVVLPGARRAQRNRRRNRRRLRRAALRGWTSWRSHRKAMRRRRHLRRRILGMDHLPFRDHYWRAAAGWQGERERGPLPGGQDPKVLQRRMSPDSSPVLNQRSLCSALPCVNDSGTT